MKIQLIDRNKEMIRSWKKHFKNCPDIEIIHGDILQHKTDCIVSPANSFGFMDGGLDLAICQKIGYKIQQRVREKIQNQFNGELLVGQAFILRTFDQDIPYLIVAPTMRVPMILKNSVNVFLATKGIFLTLHKNWSTLGKRIKTISISGLGTGVGQMKYDICAKQMKEAYSEILMHNYSFPETWSEAQERHVLLYSDIVKDLQVNND
jgi:O-acetyl-ADP-ribose deacetylase (regulator of RNase III)